MKTQAVQRIKSKLKFDAEPQSWLGVVNSKNGNLVSHIAVYSKEHEDAILNNFPVEIDDKYGLHYYHKNPKHPFHIRYSI